MASVTKLLGPESNLATATAVGLKPLVRVHNTGAAGAVTHKNAAGVVIGSVTLVANEVMNIQKAPSDTLEGGAAFLAVPIAYTN